MHTAVADEHEGTAKRGVALLSELYRRNVWADARTVNIIAQAAFHKSAAVMTAALKFFMGQARGSGGWCGGCRASSAPRSAPR